MPVRKDATRELAFIATGKLLRIRRAVGSPRLQAFLADMSARYDLILIDAPPILAVTDARSSAGTPE